MADSIPSFQYHSNRYHAAAACEHCEGIIRHEKWCITQDATVFYAYQIVADPSKLSIGDGLILRSLGVIWGGERCQGNCQAKAQKQAAAQA